MFLVVGIIFKDKPKNIQDYALGIKPFSTPVLSAAMAATLIGGGSTIGDVSYYYNEGLLVMLPLVIGYAAYIFFSHYILPKFDPYYGEVSIASVNARIYGSSVERITGVIAYVYCFGAYAMQIKAVGIVIEHTLGYKSTLATCLSFAIITAYTAFGGVKSVIRTDVIQFLIFIVILPTVAVFLLKENGGVHVVFEDSVWKTSDNFNFTSYVSLFIFSLAPKIYPMFIHRILIGKDAKKNKDVIYFTVLMQIICSLFTIVVAVVAITKYQGIESNLVFFKTIDGVTQSKIARALFAIAMLAVILSSADSLINTGAVIFVENIIKDKIKNNSIKLRMAQVVTVISGILGVIIALNSTSLLSIIFLFAQCYSVTLLVPFIGGLFIKNAKPQIFWASSITGFTSYVLLKLLVPEIAHTAYVISITLSLVAFFLTEHLIVDSRICINKYSKNLENFVENIIKQMNISVNKLSYAVIPLSFFTLFTDVLSNKISVYTTIFKVISGLIGVSFIFIDEIFKKHKQIWRNCYVLFAIWYCFPFLSSYLYYTLPDSSIAFANMVISCTLLTVIFSSGLLVIFMVIGAIVGSIASIILQPLALESFITHLIILALIVLYIWVISSFILKAKEENIKKFIHDLTKQTEGKSQPESSKILNQYSNVIKVLKRHENAKSIFLEKRFEFKGNTKSDEIINFNIEEFVETLKDYLSLKELENEAEYQISCTVKNVLINKPLSMIYTIVFSMSSYLSYFDEKIIRISFTSQNNVLFIEYTIPDLKFNMKEVVQYINLGEKEEGIINLELIEKIIKNDQDLEINIEKNSLILKILLITSDIKSKNIINIASNGRYKSLN